MQDDYTATKALCKDITQVDSKVTICHQDPLADTWIGEGGIRVPESMTSFTGYFLKLDPQQFKTDAPNSANTGDNLSLLEGSQGLGNCGNGIKLAYFSLYLSTDKPTD